MSRKATKIITAVICAVLALALVFTMIVGAFAAEIQATVDTGSTGVIIELPEDGLVSNLEGMKLKVGVVPITKEADADVYNGMLDYNDNTYFDGKHVLYMVASELHLGAEYEGNAEGVAVSPSVLTEACVYYLPLTDETKNYQNLEIVVFDGGSSSMLKPLFYKRTVDGETYLRFENDLWATVAVVCDADAQGAPVTLPFYLTGFFGFMHEAWFLFVFAFAAIILFCLFYIRRPNKTAEPAEVSAEPNAEPEDGQKDEPKDGAEKNEVPDEKPVGEEKPAVPEVEAQKGAPKHASEPDEGAKPRRAGQKHVPKHAADKKKKG